MSDTRLESHRRRLTIDWVRRLAGDEGWDLTSRTKSGNTITLGRHDDPRGLRATAVSGPPYFKLFANDPSEQGRADRILAEAAERARRGDFGGIVWYSETCREVPMSHLWVSSSELFLERMGGVKRAVGWWRLGSSIVVEFKEDPSDEGSITPLNAPLASVDIHGAVPAPIAGYHSDHLIHTWIETIVVICGLFLGRPLTLSPYIFPAEAENIPRLESKRNDPRVPRLVYRGVDLDIVSPMGIPGVEEYALRAEAALRTFDAAIRQEHRSVAILLYVIAMECLATPNQPWKKDRSTKRFRVFFEDLVPDALDQIIERDTFEQAFGIPRGKRGARALRRELLHKIYSFRSSYAHEGLDYAYRFMGFDPPDFDRRPVIRFLAEEAIMSFLAAPRSSLVGRPESGEEQSHSGCVGAITSLLRRRGRDVQTGL